MKLTRLNEYPLDVTGTHAQCPPQHEGSAPVLRSAEPMPHRGVVLVLPPRRLPLLGEGRLSEPLVETTVTGVLIRVALLMATIRTFLRRNRPPLLKNVLAIPPLQLGRVRLRVRVRHLRVVHGDRPNLAVPTTALSLVMMLRGVLTHRCWFHQPVRRGVVTGLLPRVGASTSLLWADIGPLQGGPAGVLVPLLLRLVFLQLFKRLQWALSIRLVAKDQRAFTRSQIDEPTPTENTVRGYYRGWNVMNVPPPGLRALKWRATDETQEGGPNKHKPK